MSDHLQAISPRKNRFLATRRAVVLTLALLPAASLGAMFGGRFVATSLAEPSQETAQTVPQQASPAVTWTREDAAHLLRRAGFGGTPQQIDRLYALGQSAAVEYLLTDKTPAGMAAPFAPTTLPDFKFDPEETPAKGERAKGNGAKGKAHKRDLPAAAAAVTQPTLQTTPATAPSPAEAAIAAKKAKAKKKNQQRRLELNDLRDWWIDRMARTDRPLEEKMTLFWSGLFTSGAQEVKDAGMIARQNALFHKNALGDYQTLADDIMHDPAMLRYLNANENVKGKPNENLAREFMELFTMGQGQGYTEKDVGQVARALTGMSVGRNGGVMRPRAHDAGEKTIFGHTGNYAPDDVVKLVFSQPEPPEYLARKLWEFYAYPDPSDADIQPVADALRSSHFQVVPALRVLFNSPAFYSEKAKFALIKSPSELVVETMRELGITPTQRMVNAAVRQMKTMGQELFQPPNVKGWPGGEHWITSSTLYTRYNVASAFVDGTFGGRKGGGSANQSGTVSMQQLFPNLPQNPTADQLVDAAIARFLQRPLNPAKREVLVQTLGTQPLQLGQAQSDQRVREMLSLLLSTPEFQVH